MFLSTALIAFTLAARAESPKPFEFKDGDRIVWLGNTLVEREQRYGYWETALIAANPDKKITVRNLGWSGDTVFGEARGRFEFSNADKCFKQIVEPTLELKPTVIFICYGTNESFEGKDGLPKFEKGLEKLLDALKPANARIVLFSPMQFVLPANTGNPNSQLEAYKAVIWKVADRRGHHFADIFNWNSAVLMKCSDNGMHLNEQGYESTMSVYLKSLGQADPKRGDEFEKLRQAVIAKNEQFFNKWRPQNETYLFGFRKHEQGRNAKEMAEFDPYIAKLEEQIDTLRKSLKK